MYYNGSGNYNYATDLLESCLVQIFGYMESTYYRGFFTPKHGTYSCYSIISM